MRSIHSLIPKAATKAALTAAFLVGGFFIIPALAQAATINVSSDPAGSIVEKAADRLLSLQNSNGSWDWSVTGATGPTATTYLNISGVTALGLLDAYSATGDSRYLNAAKTTGDYIVSQIDASSPLNINGYNLIFLKKLSTATGVASYGDKAQAYLGDMFSSTPTKICSSGCVDAAGLMAGYKAYRSANSVPNGIPAWDLVAFEEAASLMGSTTLAQQIEAQIVAYLDQSSYVSSVANYELGLAAGIKAAGLLGDTASTTAIAAKLPATSDGSYGADADGKVQTTAYMVMAFATTGDSRLAASSAYLLSKFGYDGINGWKETDGTEYSESTSEAAQALSLSLTDSPRYYAIQAAVNAASAGDTVNIAAGTYPESVLVSKSLTLAGAGASTVIAGTSTADYIVKISGVPAGATVSNLAIDGTGTTTGGNRFDYGIWVADSGASTTPVELKGLAVKDIWNTSSNGIEVDASTIGGSYALIHDDVISSFQKRGVRFMNSSGKVYDSEVIGDNVDGTSRVQNLINLWGGSNVEIYGDTLHNALTTSATPTWDSPAIFVSSYGGLGDSNANIHDNLIYSCDTGITLGSVYASSDASSATISDNAFHDLNWAVNLEKGTVTAAVRDNSFGSHIVYAINSDDGSGGPATKASIDAARNWWNDASGPTASSSPTGAGAAVYSGVSFAPWYVNSAKTILNTSVTGSTISVPTGNVDLTESSDGSAALPTGTSNLAMGDDSALDLASSTNVAVGTDIVIAGATTSLSSFTSGDLSAVDLAAPQTIGDQTITVSKAVKLSSGTSSPIVITNSAVSNANVSIPDGTTILAPSGWTGTIAPPKAAAASGAAPTGFSVGSTVITVGSPDVVLMFDKPVTITLTGVTGPVGYKPANSSVWKQITAACGGSYSNPSNPVFPGECAISNGTDTKILTYHFTTFGSLTANQTSSSSGGGPVASFGGGGYSVPIVSADANHDGRVDILDFVALMSGWGKTGQGIAGDFNGDGKVDISDFVMLMANWTK